MADGGVSQRDRTQETLRKALKAICGRTAGEVLNLPLGTGQWHLKPYGSEVLLGISIYETDPRRRTDYFTVRVSGGGFTIVSRSKRIVDHEWHMSSAQLEELANGVYENASAFARP